MPADFLLAKVCRLEFLIGGNNEVRTISRGEVLTYERELSSI